MGPSRRGGSSRPRGGHVARGFLVLACVLVALVGAGAFAYLHRPVEITVNGSRESVTVGTTIPEILARDGLTYKAGNFVSVKGDVLTQGGGTAYSVSVDGRSLATDAASGYGVSGGEDVEFGDGTDVMEDYDATSQTIQPKLTMDGSYGAISYIEQWGKTGTQEVRTGKSSGETTTTVTQEAQNCVVRLVNIKPANGQKLVALTFDDGPSSYTEKYLSILQEHGAVATFFNLGKSVDESASESQAIVSAGCQICSHTYSHDDLPTDSAEKVLSEVTSSFTSIQNATGVTTSAIRPPYGDFKEKTWLETQGTVTVSVLWNMDSEDWKRPGVDKIVSNAITGIQSGYIILMHDGGGNRDQDLEALPEIIDQLHNEGYTFVTISDLMKSEGDIPDDIASCSATMPSDAVWPTEAA